MKTNLSLALALAVCNFTLMAQNAPPAPAAAPEFKPFLSQIDLKDGDTLVFLGDSITHQCLYTQYIEDFYYTRYPDRRIRFHNAGVGGDTAKNALDRFDEDVAAYKPKYVTILLGMNDGRYGKFETDIFTTYERDMTTLLDRLAGSGALAVPMTPTMHDSRAARIRGKGAEPRDTQYNGVLAYFGSWLREQASVRGLGFVDMYSPLNNLTIEQRKKDPKFTMIADAVHPGAAGQVVMATAILNDMVPRLQVSQITVSQQPDGKWRNVGGNGKLTDLQAAEDKVSFTFKASALPWVLPPEAAEGYKLAKAGHRNSNEKLTVTDLKPGKFELRIDGQVVGAYTHEQLSRGVELEENDKTPQYQQALKVALLNKDRNDKAMRPLRNLWGQLKNKRNGLSRGTDAEKAAAKEVFDKWVADEFKPGVEKLKAQVKDFEDQIYQVNKPLARKYELALMR